MPPKKKKRSKSMPKQSQSQRQSVVVNIGTSKTKSKPRKSRGRGGLPPPSYQHNLAPTFVTQQATDYNPVIGAIASLTAKLNEQPRIQQPVTPLSSTVQATSQSAEQMAGEAAIGRAESTADSFVPHASQADERFAQKTQDKLDVQDEQAFKQKISSGSGQVSVSSGGEEASVSGGGGQKTIGGGQYPSIGKLLPKSEESKLRDAKLDVMMDKRADASKKQVDTFKVIRDKIDQNIELSAEELKKAKSPTGISNLGKKRNKKIQGM